MLNCAKQKPNSFAVFVARRQSSIASTSIDLGILNEEYKEQKTIFSYSIMTVSVPFTTASPLFIYLVRLQLDFVLFFILYIRTF